MKSSALTSPTCIVPGSRKTRVLQQIIGGGKSCKVLFFIFAIPAFNIYHSNINNSTIAMAVFSSSPVSQLSNQGRSGYNKDGDSEDDKRCLVNFGRSGYNKDDGSEDDKKNFGRSGYNKDGDNEDDSRHFNFGRSGYN
ncbi:hypothetical protein F5Y04DRAFT_283815 [Hypomontagnella monticulosa]|nr:hypothetical protein F5Y04DRAFT_283815 [Hypomontagnella monticulosa]